MLILYFISTLGMGEIRLNHRLDIASLFNAENIKISGRFYSIGNNSSKDLGDISVTVLATRTCANI
jgi:hypothetical protein